MSGSCSYTHSPFLKPCVECVRDYVHLKESLLAEVCAYMRPLIYTKVSDGLAATLKLGSQGGNSEIGTSVVN